MIVGLLNYFKRPDFMPHFIIGAIVAAIFAYIGHKIGANIYIMAVLSSTLAGVLIELSQWIGWPRKGVVDYTDVLNTAAGALPVVIVISIVVAITS